MYTVVLLEKTNIQDEVFLWRQLAALDCQLYLQKNSPLDVWLILATSRV